MTAQELIIYAIVRKRLIELLKPELVDYFEDTKCFKLYETCFMLKMRKQDLSIENISNYLYKDTDIKLEHKKIYIDYLKQITEGNKYVDVLNLENILEEEWYSKQFQAIQKTLADGNATKDIKKNIISETSNIINRTRRQDDFKNVYDILKEFRNNSNAKTILDFNASLINLTDEHLIRIFDNTIYPHMYSILGRPGDFKTSLLFNLILHFNELKKPGIIVSLEDSSEMASFKIFSLLSGLDKRSLVQHSYDNKIFDDNMAVFKKNIFIMDRNRTADEIFIDLDNKLSVGNYCWIAVDFLQEVTGEKYLSEYEKVSNLDRKLFELNKKHTIPVFRLTQAPKEQIQGTKMLGMGDEKGSGEIAHRSRYALSVNGLEDDKESERQKRRINIYKTTFCSRKILDVIFHGPTGRILEVYNV